MACMPSSELQSNDQTWLRVVLALVPNLNKLRRVPGCGLAGLAKSHLHGGVSSNGHDGSAQSGGYCGARGEILRPLQDQLQRRRSARARSSIKNESVGSEDDQTPS